MSVKITSCKTTNYKSFPVKKIWLLTLLFFIIPGSLLNRADACSTFFLRNGNHIVCGRNFDYSYGKYLIFVNKRNVTKTALQYSSEVVDLPAVWTTKYGSITFNMDGCDVTTDGMNEAGLVVTSLILLESQFPDVSGQSSVSIDQFGQYLLDNCGTVAEVIEICSKINIRYNPHDYWRLHMFVTDKDGNNAAIEFLDGHLVATTGANLEKNVLTNSSYESSIEYYYSERNPDLPLTASLSRFCTAVDMVDAYQNQDIYDYAYSIMDAVAQRHTQRKIIYDISNMRVYLKSMTNDKLRYFDMSALDFSCQSPMQVYQETTEDVGNIRDKFVDYTTEINKTSTQMGWNFLGMEYTEAELDEFAQYPSTFKCGLAYAGEDRTLCSDSCTIEGNAATNYTGQWTIVSGNASFDNPNERNTMVRNLAQGENILRWTLTSNFDSFSDEVKITNNMAIADAGDDQKINQNSVYLAANEPTEGAGQWSVHEGNASLSNPDLHNTYVSDLSEGMNKFVWEVTNLECSDKDTVEIVFENGIVSSIGSVKIYPNPTVQLVNIEFTPETEHSIKLEILNLSGKQVYSQIQKK